MTVPAVAALKATLQAAVCGVAGEIETGAQSCVAPWVKMTFPVNRTDVELPAGGATVAVKVTL